MDLYVLGFVYISQKKKKRQEICKNFDCGLNTVNKDLQLRSNF